MNIRSILIAKLHGQHDRLIEFDPELTYLYGANGCGKTTILNILAAVITGKLYNLCDYSFSKIELCYGRPAEEFKIVIKLEKKKGKESALLLDFQKEKYIIEDFANLKEQLYRYADDESIEEIFVKKYPFAKTIKDTFNYVYLPLNRFGVDEIDERDFYRYGFSRRRFFEIQQNPYNSYLNNSLKYISRLVKDSCMEINVEENRINDKFRKDVLTSMISVSETMEITNIFEGIKTFEWQEVQNNKEAYIKTLKDIGVYDDKLQVEIDNYFSSFENVYVESMNKDKETLDLAWQYAEFAKIRKITELAKEYEKRKEKNRKPLNTFLSIIDDFFSSSGTKKTTRIDSNGRIVFKTSTGDLQLENLSSGEKQIVITFASMIFGLRGKSTGIFIVDEPEASLHLEWQAKFVPAILKTEKNVQLIFATHSPELIGPFQNKAYKIV